MAGDGKSDFFISYTQADKAWAKWVAQTLESAGYTTKLQELDFVAGPSFIAEMDDALKSCEVTMPLYSDPYFASPMCKAEWMPALYRQWKEGRLHLLPLRIQDCSIDGILSTNVYVDLVGLSEDEAKARLIDEVKAAIKGNRRESAGPAAFPGKPVARFPGPSTASHKIVSIPHLRNPNFTGRVELIDELHKTLASGGAVALTAIHGMGGVGKTQIALEYSHRRRADYDVLWWLRAEKPSELATDLEALGARLGLQGEYDMPETLRQKTIAWLAENGNWLLVFDNAESAADLTPYIPRGASGHIIITSRNRDWGAVATPLEVTKMSLPDAVQLLLKRSGSTDHASAEALAKELDCLPLALEHAGAYAAATGISLSEYLELFQKDHTRLLKTATVPQAYDHTLLTTWDMSIRRLEAETPEAVDLLRFLAFVGPDRFPKRLLADHAQHLPERLRAAAADELRLNSAIAALLRYSLISVEGATLSTHRLVQMIVRDALDPGSAKTWASSTIAVVNAAFPYQSRDVRTWPICAELLPHAQAAVGHRVRIDRSPDAAGRLLNQMGLYLRGRADYTGAREAYERTLEISEGAYGKNHPVVATAINNLARVLHETGDLAEAKHGFERAIEIGEAAYGKNHPVVATYANNLARVLHDMGDLKGAKDGFERALAIDEAAYGKDHPDVATDVNNLAGVLRDMGNLKRAKELLERALEIDGAAYGKDHPEVATDVNNLALVLQDMGEHEAAKTGFERALEIDEAAYGKDHPTVAIRVNNLAGVLQDMGDLNGARQGFEHALAVFKAAFGNDHPHTKLVQGNLDSLQD